MIWLFTNRSWLCRLLLHRRCWNTWPSAAVDWSHDQRRELEVTLCCSCRCHGTKL